MQIIKYNLCCDILVLKGGIMTIAMAKHSLFDIMLAFAVGIALTIVVMLLVNYAPAELSQLELEKLGQLDHSSLESVNSAP